MNQGEKFYCCSTLASASTTGTVVDTRRPCSPMMPSLCIWASTGALLAIEAAIHALSNSSISLGLSKFNALTASGS